MKKNIVRTICLVLIICVFGGITQTAMATADQFRTTSTVNLRSEPSTSASVVSRVNADASVEVTAHDPAGWSRVRVGGSSGYIRSDFLRLPVGNTPPTFRTTSGVNIRANPATDASVLDTVERGTSVEVLQHNPDAWSRVRSNDITGYIRSDFLTRSEPGTSIGEGAGASQAAPPAQAVITLLTIGRINMRSGASTDTDIVRELPANTSVEVLESQSNGWSRVRHNGTDGFIRSDLLSATGAPAGGVSSTLLTTGRVNMRSGSSTETTIVRELAPNTRVEVLEAQANGWSRVRHNGTDGFIRSDLLSATGAPATGASSTLLTTGRVNMRSGSSTDTAIIRELPANTRVEVLEAQANGWSRVRHDGTDGFIRSDLISATGAPAQAPQTLMTLTGVNVRSGPSTNHSVTTTLAMGTTVTVLERRSDGWSNIRHNNTTGYIRSDFLGTSARRFEMIEWSEARRILPRGRDIHVVDARTGISFNLRAFSLGNHADVEPPTQADTDAIRRTRNGTWSWSARPVWVTVGDRTFPASLNGMPHAGSTISGNGINGHFCLWFSGSTSTGSTSASYRRNMLNTVTEAWNLRPR